MGDANQRRKENLVRKDMPLDMQFFTLFPGDPCGKETSL